LFLGHEIIPAGILDPEILHRVKCWVEDTNGRRDFSHVLNVELRKWEMKKKAELKSIAEEQSKNGKNENTVLNYFILQNYYYLF
jgi:hypothetical protein